MNEGTVDLDAEVREMLLARRGEWQRVAAAADVSHSWISKFVRGKIPNPGYVTLRELRKYLAASSIREAA